MSNEVNQLFYEMYEIWCNDRNMKPTMKDFNIWLDERYPDERV